MYTFAVLFFFLQKKKKKTKLAKKIGHRSLIILFLSKLRVRNGHGDDDDNKKSIVSCDVTKATLGVFNIMQHMAGKTKRFKYQLVLHKTFLALHFHTKKKFNQCRFQETKIIFNPLRLTLLIIILLHA